MADANDPFDLGAPPVSGSDKNKNPPLPIGVPLETDDAGELLFEPARKPSFRPGVTTRTGRWMFPYQGVGPYSEDQMRAARENAEYQFYVDGDEWRPAGWSADAIARVQRRMVEAGLLEEDAILKWGVWDEGEAEAYRTVLGYANRQGTTAGQAMRFFRENPVPGDPSKEPAPLVYVLPDVRDVTKTADEMAQRTLGRRFTDDERQRFVSSYMQTVRDTQLAEYNVSNAAADGSDWVTPGTTLYEPPSVGAMAEDYAKRTDPGGVEAHGSADLYTQLLSTLGINYG